MKINIKLLWFRVVICVTVVLLTPVAVIVGAWKGMFRELFDLYCAVENMWNGCPSEIG
jgi:hypothetical protein